MYVVNDHITESIGLRFATFGLFGFSFMYEVVPVQERQKIGKTFPSVTSWLIKCECNKLVFILYNFNKLYGVLTNKRITLNETEVV